jgi:hypothetical protein
VAGNSTHARRMTNDGGGGGRSGGRAAGARAQASRVGEDQGKGSCCRVQTAWSGARPQDAEGSSHSIRPSRSNSCNRGWGEAMGHNQDMEASHGCVLGSLLGVQVGPGRALGSLDAHTCAQDRGSKGRGRFEGRGAELKVAGAESRAGALDSSSTWAPAAAPWCVVGRTTAGSTVTGSVRGGGADWATSPCATAPGARPPATMEA